MNKLLLDAYAIVEVGRRLSNRMDDVWLCEDYTEPGYTSSGAIAFGNWNDESKYVDGERVVTNDTPSRICNALEKIGVEIEWSDEWTQCCDCGGAIRTSPDGYGWKRSYVEINDEYVCEDCVIKSDSASRDLLESLEGEQSRCLTLDGVCPDDFGYRRLDQDFEYGLHPGQAADPKLIGKALEARGVYRYLFVLDSVGQFDMDFSVWIHEDEFKELELPRNETELALSPAEGCAMALRQAAIKMAELPAGPGVRMASCDVGTGTATAELVSPEDFVSGRRPSHRP